MKKSVKLLCIICVFILVCIAAFAGTKKEKAEEKIAAWLKMSTPIEGILQKTTLVETEQKIFSQIERKLKITNLKEKVEQTKNPEELIIHKYPTSYQEKFVQSCQKAQKAIEKIKKILNQIDKMYEIMEKYTKHEKIDEQLKSLQKSIQISTEALLEDEDLSEIMDSFVQPATKILDDIFGKTTSLFKKIKTKKPKNEIKEFAEEFFQEILKKLIPNFKKLNVRKKKHLKTSILTLMKEIAVLINVVQKFLL